MTTTALGSTYSSSVANVEVITSETTVSDVKFYRPGDDIYRASDNREFDAEYLLVESDNHPWGRSSDRTLKLRITPKQAGDFEMLVRGWICADEYTNCSREPGAAWHRRRRRPAGLECQRVQSDRSSRPLRKCRT